ncbi:hypothetical protein [Pseudomonas tolaasii]
MREEFEAWAETRKQSLKRQGEGYAFERTDLTWKAWKASREAIVIELPSVCQSDDPFDLKRDIIYEIETAGLKTK